MPYKIHVPARDYSDLSPEQEGLWSYLTYDLPEDVVAYLVRKNQFPLTDRLEVAQLWGGPELRAELYAKASPWAPAALLEEVS